MEWWDVKGGKKGATHDSAIDVEEFSWFIGYWAETPENMANTLEKFKEATNYVFERDGIKVAPTTKY